ncbi:MAG: hypothetical protein GY842_18890 [bacterium]|nr:hypothetical protein [bacterium]
MRVWIDKIASATSNVPVRHDGRLTQTLVPREGHIVAARVVGEKSTYNQLEDLHGRMVALHDGDIIAGVLGERSALQGYSGVVPSELKVGDRLQVLNLGGVLGVCTSENPDVGRPFNVEVLGAVLVFPDFENRTGVPAHIGMNAIPVDSAPLPAVPVVYVAGTCMNSGKTTAACQLIRELSKRGAAVGACKLTGVSLRRDVLQMLDYGASWSVSFTEAGAVSTNHRNAVPVTRALLAHLADAGAEVIVAELGDGVHGEYGVGAILADEELMELCAALVMCANDPVGAWGARRILDADFGLSIDVMSGPTTDNAVGTDYVQRELGLAALNARTHGTELGELMASKVAAHSQRGLR